MGIWNTAAKAVQWLIAGARKMTRNRELTRAMMRSLGVSDKLQARFGSYLDKMAKVEQLHGEHTSFWKLIAQAAKAQKNGKPVLLTIDGQAHDFGRESVYAYHGKKAFDSTLKPIGLKAIGTPDDTDEPIAIPPIGDVPEMSTEELDDSDLQEIDDSDALG